MAKTQSKKRLVVTIIVLLVVALAIAGAVLAKNLANPSDTKAPETTQPSTDVPAADSSTEVNSDQAAKPDTAVAPAVDPATLSSVAIEPLGITVFYSKGVPGFDFAVKRTADKTEYVEFSTAALVGTKCTDDEGAFASIIKNPGVNETQTTSQTVRVGDDTYGLSLSGSSCTADAELLTQYQTAFTNGFKSLTAL